MTATRSTIINRSEAHDMLTAAQKRSRTRTFSSVEEIAGTVDSIVEDLWVFAALTLDQLDGITLTVDAAQGEHFPSSYAGRPQSTHATLRFTPKGWVVESVTRGDVSTRSTTPWLDLTLSREQLDLAASRWGDGFGITLTTDWHTPTTERTETMTTTEATATRAAIYRVAEPGIEVCRGCGGHTSYRDRSRGWCPWHGWEAGRCGSACDVSRYCRCGESL